MNELLLPADEIREMVAQRGHRVIAEILCRMNVPFEAAYKAIFRREPRQIEEKCSQCNLPGHPIWACPLYNA